MKKLSLFEVLPIIAVALVGVAIATSCEKKTDSNENQENEVIDDQLQKQFLGKWVSRGMSSWGDPVCSPSDLNSDTISFLPNHTLLDNCDCSGCGGLNGVSYTIISDTSVVLGSWEFDVKFTNVDTLIIYNWRPCNDVASYNKHVIFTKINN